MPIFKVFERVIERFKKINFSLIQKQKVMKKNGIRFFSKILAWSLAIGLLTFSCQELNIETPSELTDELGSDAGNNLVPGMYIVTLHDNSPDFGESGITFRKSGKYEDAQFGMRKVAVDVTSRYNISSQNIKNVFGNALTGFTVFLSKNELKELLKDPSVKSIIQDRFILDSYSMKKTSPGKPIVEPEPEPDPEPDPNPKLELWNLDRIDQRNLPLNGIYSPPNSAGNVTAYIVGSAINLNHVEFEGRATNVDLTNSGPGFTNPNPLSTEIAGVIGGKTVGVAKGVNLVGVVSFTQNFYGSHPLIYKSDILAGLDWVYANASGPSLLWLSALGPTEEASIDLDTLIYQALDALFEKGVSLFTFSGAWGIDACNWMVINHPHVFTTSMTDKYDYKLKEANYGSCIDLFAPGLEILTADGTTDTGYKYGNSNLITSAQTMGVAAMYLQTNPTASPQQVYDFLIETSTKNVVKFSRSENNYLLYSGLNNIGAGVHDPSLNYYFELAASANKVNGSTWRVNLSWNQASISGDRLNLYVDGVGFASVLNNGYLQLEEKGRNIPPKTYQLCVPGTTQCSNIVTITFK